MRAPARDALAAVAAGLLASVLLIPTQRALAQPTPTPTPTPIPVAGALPRPRDAVGPDAEGMRSPSSRASSGAGGGDARGGTGTAAARVDVCGPITADTTWTSANVYVITCEVTVAAGATLTVLPGTVVKAYYGNFTPGAITVLGRLVAEGTVAAPIVFTSIADDAHGGDTNGDGDATTPAPGDWQSLNFEAGSSGRLANATVAYGGKWYFYDNEALLRCADADVRLDRATLRASYQAGLSARRCRVAVTDSTFADNGWNALDIGGLAAGEPFALTHNRFGPGAAGTVYFDGMPHGPVAIRDNVAVDGTTGLDLRGTLAADLDWHNDALALLLVEGLTVAPGATLTLAPGSLVKAVLYDFGPGGLEVNGSLAAEGTPAAPIVFTSAADDAHGGDTNGDGPSAGLPGQWSAVTVNAGGRARIAHAEVLYGGGYTFFYGSRALVRAMGGEAILDDVTLGASAWSAVYAENGSVAVRTSRMEGNAWNIWNETPPRVVDARFNWWGDPSGPRHPSKNPEGLGRDVTDGVLFFPWAIDRDGTVPSQVTVQGPTSVSAGETVEYAVSYYAGEDVGDAVLTLRLPLWADYVEEDGNGSYWVGRHEVFWNVGPLAAGSAGTRSTRVRYEWGLWTGLSDSPQGLLRSATAEDAAFHPAPYLDHAPPRVLDERPLSPAEIDAERQARPDVDELYRNAESDGFRFLRGTRVTSTDGIEATELLFVRPDAATVVRRVAEEVLSHRVDATSWSVGDGSGGLKYDAALGQMTFSGDWGTASAVRATPVAPFGACIGNCLLVGPGDPEWSGGAVAHDAFHREVGDYLTVVRSRQCLEFYNGSGSSEACSDAVRSAIRGGAELLKAMASQCQTDCRQDVTRYRCDDGERASMCLRRFQTSARVLVETLPFLGGGGELGQPYYETFACVNGVFQFFDRTACVHPTATSIECDQDRTLRRGLWIPRARCLGGGIGGELADRTTRSKCVFGYAPRGAAPPPSECAPAGRVRTGIRAAHDPNAKSGDPGDVLPGQETTYTVAFENEGEGIAYDVYVLDELSPHLDETTLVLNGAGEFSPVTRTILWDIGELAPKGEPGSKGERSFSIRVKSGLPGGTVITNQATVYFPSVPEETATNTVVNVVQPLAAVPQSLETPYGTPIAITLAGRDVSGTPLTYAIVEPPLAGTLSGTPPNLTYTHAENFTGQDRFTFTVGNGTSTSRPAAVTILITPSSADAIAPEVLWTYPEDGAVLEEVPADPAGGDEDDPVYAPSLLAGFSEAMDESTITGATVTVVGAGGRVMAATVAWDGTLNQAVLTPGEAWQNGAYTATVTTAARDASGNPLAADYSWRFRIGAAASCAGDCNGNGAVSIDELIKGVNIALGGAGIEQCPSFDANGGGTVTIDELVRAVNNALAECPSPARTATPTHTVAPPPSASATASHTAPATQTGTPTHTVTGQPSASVTASPATTATRTATATRTLTTTPGAPVIHLSSPSGHPGAEVTFSATLDTRGRAVAGTQNDVTFDPLRIAVAAVDGEPDCTITAGAGAESLLSFRPPGCAGSGCTGIRVVIYGAELVIPNGAELYHCRVRIAADAPPGPYPLSVSGVRVADPEGSAIPGASATGGAVIVEAAAPPTSTRPFLSRQR